MKKILLAIVILYSAVHAVDSCDRWYSDVRKKYHIAGTKTGLIYDDAGNWKKFFAKGTSSVDFADEDEYEDALSEAQMKAKANMAHFLKESISSERFIRNVSKKLKELKTESENQQSIKVDKKTLKIKTENIRNSAHTLLKGVIVLCESIDPKKKRAVVVVGVSPKTQKAADKIRKSMHHSNEPEGSAVSSTTKRNIEGYMDAADNLDF